MTRLAVISDVHADVHALQDALVQIERLGCDQIVCAGDLIGYGLFPEETIALLRERRVPCVRGNHDRWAVSEGGDSSGWDLTSLSVEFLESVPTSWSKLIDGVRVVAWHARPGSDMEGVYPDTVQGELRAMLDQAEADVLVVGHTHVALRREVGRRLVVNPGALLREPAGEQESRAWIYDPDKGAFGPGPVPGVGTFGVVELPSRRFTVRRAADGAEVSVAGEREAG